MWGKRGVATSRGGMDANKSVVVPHPHRHEGRCRHRVDQRIGQKVGTVQQMVDLRLKRGGVGKTTGGSDLQPWSRSRSSGWERGIAR